MSISICLARTLVHRARSVTVLLLIVALSAVGPSPASASPQACGAAAAARLVAADGTRLSGNRYGKGTTAVVLAHESRGNSCQWQWYARQLAARGYLALAFEFRNYGDSQRRTGAASDRAPADVVAAVRLVRS